MSTAGDAANTGAAEVVEVAPATSAFAVQTMGTGVAPRGTRLKPFLAGGYVWTACFGLTARCLVATVNFMRRRIFGAATFFFLAVSVGTGSSVWVAASAYTAGFFGGTAAVTATATAAAARGASASHLETRARLFGWSDEESGATNVRDDTGIITCVTVSSYLTEEGMTQVTRSASSRLSALSLAEAAERCSAEHGAEPGCSMDNRGREANRL